MRIPTITFVAIALSTMAAPFATASLAAAWHVSPVVPLRAGTAAKSSTFVFLARMDRIGNRCIGRGAGSLWQH